METYEMTQQVWENVLDFIEKEIDGSSEISSFTEGFLYGKYGLKHDDSKSAYAYNTTNKNLLAEFLLRFG